MAQCRSMSTEDIRLALATELEAWTPPQGDAANLLI